MKDDIIVHSKTFYSDQPKQLLEPISTADFQIFQVGAFYYAKSINTSDHEQYFDIELTICLSDNIKCYANGKETICKKNDVYISFKDESHKIVARDFSIYQFIAFNFLPNTSAYFLLKEFINHYKNSARTNNNNKIPRIMNDVFKCVWQKEQSPYNNIFINAKITEMLVLLLDSQSLHDAEVKNSSELIPRICNYIDTSFLQIISLSDLSLYFGYTYEYLSTIFKKEMNVTLQSYLTAKKMEYAQTLFSEKNMSVAEVSELLAYISPNNFSRAYHKYFGHNPIDDKP